MNAPPPEAGCADPSAPAHSEPIQLRTEEEDTKPRLITHKDVIGQFAMWALRQHPYGRPDGLFDVTDAIEAAAKAWPDGIDSLKMWEVGSWQEIEDWLRQGLRDHPVLTAWNTPRSGHTQQIVSSSRFWAPKPEHDFIDIDALLRNVAMGVWREAGRE